MSIKAGQMTSTNPFPQFQETQTIQLPKQQDSEISQSFNARQQNFAKLANAEQLQELNENLIKISIDEELGQLDAEHQLEISVPILGLTDLLPNEDINVQSLQFAPPVAINGFGAVSGEGSDSFPYPEFILATDIMGNKYEVMMDENGQLQLPAEGTGLFSMLSYLTFIYSDWQIKKGTGLADLQDLGIEKNYIYLLSPVYDKSFSPKIAVTHYDEYNHKVVDSLRTVKVEYSAGEQQDRVEADIKRFDSHDGLELNFDLSEFNFNKVPKTLEISLQYNDNVELSLNHPSSPFELFSVDGWIQSAINPNSFVKHFGVSEETKTLLIRDVYSEYDMTKGYLAGDEMGISNHNNFNNFMIYPEAFGKVYDLIIDGLASETISSDFLWDRVDLDSPLGLNLLDLDLPIHDSIVLSENLNMNESLHGHDLKTIFDSSSHSELSLKLYSDQSLDHEPSIQVDVYPLTDIAKTTNFAPLNHRESQQIEDALANQSLHSRQNDSNTIEFKFNANEIQGLDLQLRFDDVIQGGLGDEVMNNNQLEQNLVDLLGDQSENSSNQVSYSSSDMHIAESGYTTDPLSAEIHFGFTQDPEI